MNEQLTDITTSLIVWDTDCLHLHWLSSFHAADLTNVGSWHLPGRVIRDTRYGVPGSVIRWDTQIPRSSLRLVTQDSISVSQYCISISWYRCCQVGPGSAVRGPAQLPPADWRFDLGLHTRYMVQWYIPWWHNMWHNTACGTSRLTLSCLAVSVLVVPILPNPTISCLTNLNTNSNPKPVILDLS